MSSLVPEKVITVVIIIVIILPLCLALGLTVSVLMRKKILEPALTFFNDAVVYK